MRSGEHKDIKIPFGKYKGQLIADLPDMYLEWLLDQGWMHEKFESLVQQTKIELEYRSNFNINIE